MIWYGIKIFGDFVVYVKIKFLMFLYIGYLDVDDVLKMLLGNLNMVGVIFFCFFDNIVLGICFSFDIYLVVYFMYVCIRL